MKNSVLLIARIVFFLFSFTRTFAQDIEISKPAYNCTNCTTFYLEKGKPAVIFVYITGNETKIEHAGGDGILYRGWKEVESAFGDNIQLLYINDYGSMVLENSEVLDFRNTDKYYQHIYYWDGKEPVQIKELADYVYLTEQIASLLGENAISSYQSNFERDSLFFHTLITSNDPSKEIIEHLKYCREFEEKGMEYFPYQFLDLQGVKKVEMSIDPAFKKKGFRISLNSQQMIEEMVGFEEGLEDYIENVFEYKDGLLTSSKYKKYAYKGDTLIAYTDKYAALSVLKNKLFIPILYCRLDTDKKTFEKITYTITENKDGSITTESNNGHKTFYSNTEWKVPLKIGDGECISFTFTDDKHNRLKCEKYEDEEPGITIVYELENGKIKLANVTNHYKNYTMDIYYRYY